MEFYSFHFALIKTNIFIEGQWAHLGSWSMTALVCHLHAAGHSAQRQQPQHAQLMLVVWALSDWQAEHRSRPATQIAHMKSTFDHIYMVETTNTSSHLLKRQPRLIISNISGIYRCKHYNFRLLNICIRIICLKTTS